MLSSDRITKQVLRISLPHRLLLTHPLMATFAAAYQQFYQQAHRQVHLRCSTAEVPCPEALGYTQGKTLGSGTYAKVKAAWSPYEHRMIAIKNLQKRMASRDYLSKFLPREIEVLQLVKHPNILHVYQIIETEDKCFFMLELAENGDLLDYINFRGHIPEDEARYIFKQMTGALHFCHSIGVVHRDLKCENIMMSGDMQVKVGDFGFAVHTEDPVTTPCGSYSYAAPELFTSDKTDNRYDGKKADSWSLGVILYAMVCGRLPFGDDSQVKKSNERVLTFNRHISSNCKHLLVNVLQTDPSNRFTCADILQHPWINGPARVPGMLQTQAKYTLDNSLPLMFQQPHGSRPEMAAVAPYPSVPVRGHSSRLVQMRNTQPESSRTIRIDAHATAQTVTHSGTSGPARGRPKQTKPLVAKIGAAGKRIADAVRNVGQSKGQLLDDSSHSNTKFRK